MAQWQPDNVSRRHWSSFIWFQRETYNHISGAKPMCMVFFSFWIIHVHLISLNLPFNCAHSWKILLHSLFLLSIAMVCLHLFALEILMCYSYKQIWNIPSVLIIDKSKTYSRCPFEVGTWHGFCLTRCSLQMHWYPFFSYQTLVFAVKSYNFEH